MTSAQRNYMAGMSYENFLRRLAPTSNEIQMRCSGEMQHLLAIEDGSGRHIKGQPTQAKWLAGMQKKVLKAFDKLLKAKALAGAQRETVTRMREKASVAQSAHDLHEVIELTWPIVHEVLPNDV